MKRNILVIISIGIIGLFIPFHGACNNYNSQSEKIILNSDELIETTFQILADLNDMIK